MENFERLLLLTAFTCIACDGEIAKDEVSLLKEMASENKVFGDIDVDKVLETLIKQLEEQGIALLEEYFEMLSSAELSEDEQVKVLQVASDAINADNVIEYSEIKYFKSIRRCLSVADDVILEKVTGIEDFWLEQDVTDISLSAENIYTSLQFADLKIEQ